MSAFTDDYYYRREIVTDELDEACDAIAAGLGIDRSAIGTKGNEKHDSGAHRSQDWILNSPFCDDRHYTVQPGLTADQLLHIAGVDITPGEWGTVDNRRKTAEITARVIAEMRAGRLDIVLAVYGAAPDLRTVTGWDNVENRPASSDSSHLDHPHLTLDRKKLRDRAALGHLAAVVIGEDMFGDTDRNNLSNVLQALLYGGPSCGRAVEDKYALNLGPANTTNARELAARQYKNGIMSQLNQVRGDLADLLAAVRDGDGSAVTPEQMDKLATDVADRLGALQFVGSLPAGS